MAAVLRTLFHAGTFLWFSSVWVWHWTPYAAYLPGAKGFGVFFKFLTFCGFTYQVFGLGLALVDDLLRKGRRPSRLSRLSDDVSCSSFGAAHVVTLMFHIIHYTIGGAIDDTSVYRPPWLDLSMHKANAAVAWIDLLLAAPRSRRFSPRAQLMSIGFMLSYSTWILVCRHMNGRFPYPFLDALPYPGGFGVVQLVSCSVFLGMFHAGKALNAQLNKARSVVLELDVDTQISHAADDALVASLAPVLADDGAAAGRSKVL